MAGEKSSCRGAHRLKHRARLGRRLAPGGCRYRHVAFHPSPVNFASCFISSPVPSAFLSAGLSRMVA